MELSLANKIKSEQKERLIGKVEGAVPGPLILFFAGIHGNEPAGVIALQNTLKALASKKSQIRGNIYGIVGNVQALQVGKRFLDEDLNRIWTSNRINKLQQKEFLSAEEKEMMDLLNFVQVILEGNKAPVYFIDFHTTSSKTYPFITINDALINRKFAMQFPVPVVLGIEEYLDGPMLSYINQKGFVGIGFESGQHQEASAIKHAEAFIYLTLRFAGAIKKRHFPEWKQYFQVLDKSAASLHKIFEIVYLHKIGDLDQFKMFPGFESFQVIPKGKDLAYHDGVTIKSSFNGRIFMPLYQSQGSDGFFIIHRIPYFALKLSSFLRKLKIDNLLPLLPGVSWENKEKMVLKVNLKTARFLTTPFFHLFGYRIRILDGDYLKLSNRERVAKKDMYRGERWY